MCAARDPRRTIRAWAARAADSLKVFLGMAAGVGKTYRMLQEGHAEREAGRDVVIGYMEPHDRPETSALAEGLEAVPRRRVTYRGTELEEMDLPALLGRAPELALIDELAHTNAPGVEHRKRYEDVARRPRRRDRRLLDRQRPAPGVAQRPGHRADRDPGARDDPRRGAGRGRRGRAGRPHPGGADRAPARGQGLPRRERSRRRSTTSSPSRTCWRCARSRCARWRAEVEGEAAGRRGAARHARGADRRRGAAGGRRAAARAGAPAALLAAARAARLALGAAARRRARPALGEAAAAWRSRARSRAR